MATTFIEWVCTRKAHDNPRGDFIRDTREVKACGFDDSQMEDAVLRGCKEAIDIYHQLRREFDRRA